MTDVEIPTLRSFLLEINKKYTILPFLSKKLPIVLKPSYLESRYMIYVKIGNEVKELTIISQEFGSDYLPIIQGKLVKHDDIIYSVEIIDNRYLWRDKSSSAYWYNFYLNIL